ncbi:hypothetical protein A5893_08225 [Pedobacter psychrophilus]|uniref:Uncharacterized protein n=1 Tax=Pedobacter psychrophilus TaxID=1826909 RepID=A0A179DEW9_9SPHI|nr:hypothetical protein [Pedobacter psychrophilus]OAQ39571.1 hypothetical protein A5893_08225 [Pedobacter psychrophilus]
MKTTLDSNFNNENENFGGEFSILNSNRFEKNTLSHDQTKSNLYTAFLYLLSIVSITCWIISLKVLPFGDIFQFLLGAVVLSVNLMVFKWTKL